MLARPDILTQQETLEDKQIRANWRARHQKVNGERYIIDWTKTEYNSTFGQLAYQLQRFLGDCFYTQQHLHSNIISVRPQKTQISKGKIVFPSQVRDQFSSCELNFSINKAVISREGNIHLVLYNELALASIREQIISTGHGFDLFSLNTEFLNTCSLVLGYFTRMDQVSKKQLHLCENLLGAWIQRNAGNTFSVDHIELVSYKDTAFVNTKTLASLQLANEVQPIAISK